MAYEVITARFRTELHARWSVFFDQLEVPWAYEPASFEASDGDVWRPAFWLPRERIWFDAEPSHAPAPALWECFARAARKGDCSSLTDRDGEDFPHPAVAVGTQWQGQALLASGTIPSGYGTPYQDGPWNEPAAVEMRADNDAMYRWTLCPVCAAFGATYFGDASRLPCQCLREKCDNTADERLLAAYRAASGAFLFPADGPSTEALRSPLMDVPAAREALIRQEGAGLAQERCTGQCRSLSEQLRAELPAGAYVEANEDNDALCGECPGFVCAQCGEGPAAAAGAACRVCEPVVLLTYDRARQLLNDLAGVAGHGARRPARDINTLINRATPVRSRAEASMGQLAFGLTLVESWIADPSLVPAETARRGAPLSSSELEQLHGQELRRVLNQQVGPLVSATGCSFALIQLQLNYVMGVEKRADAGDAQLREAILLAQQWVESPATYREHVRQAAAKVEPGGLPAPMRTRKAAEDFPCALCGTQVAAGELTGRLHAPVPGRFVWMGWLCAHCLYERRAKPRRLDVLLRLFHLIFAGDRVGLNAAEAKVLLQWLLDIPASASAENTAAQEAMMALRQAIDEGEVAVLRYFPSQAVVTALHQGIAHAALTEDETVVLNAAAQHLAEWRDPQLLDQSAYPTRVQWRRAVLECSNPPTVLSQRGGPFFV